MTPRHTRRTEKQRTERQRRDEREQAKEMQERAQQEAEPRRGYFVAFGMVVPMRLWPSSGRCC